jgi:uncharacterized protein (TIGR02145 family)
LENAVGGKDIAGTKLKSAAGWNENGNGTNDFGFSALPGGSGNSDGDFYYAGNFGSWWSATEYFQYGSSSSAGRPGMHYNGESVGWDFAAKTDLFSVRCVAD